MFELSIWKVVIVLIFGGFGIYWIFKQRFMDVGDIKVFIKQNGKTIRINQLVYGQKHGLWFKWYDNGYRHVEENYKNGKFHGTWILWHKNGQKQGEGDFIDGKQHGLWTYWYDDGQKRSERGYDNNNPIGTWIVWYENGQKQSERGWKDGEQIDVKLFDKKFKKIINGRVLYY